jgi:hypothetical protein
MKLYEIAHSRAGDKGNTSSISVFPYDENDYPLLVEHLTAERVLAWFELVGATKVVRYEVPTLCALNFVLENTLGGGVTRSLALDKHGKSLSSLMLEIEI